MPGTLPLGEMLGGKYRVLRYTCEGGIGFIYEADAGGGRRVAVEVAHPDLATDPERLSRFYDESHAASGNHVAQVIDAGRAGDGSPYLIVEALDGQTLAARLAEQGKFPPGRAAHIVKQILEALGPVHRTGLAHRALAPEHIFLIEREGDPDFVKVLDFGFNQLIGEEAQARTSATALAYPLPYCMSPEQARHVPSDHRVDIYACGVLLYLMTTGRPPFPGTDVPSLLGAIAAGRHQPARAFAPDLKPELEQAIGYAMALDPAHRYQSAEHLSQTLAPLAQAIMASQQGRDRTMRPPHDNSAPLAAQMDETTRKSSRAVPIVVGIVLALGVPGILLAVRSSGSQGGGSGEIAVRPTEPTEKPVDKPAEPTDKPAEPTDKPAEPTDKPAEPVAAAETPDAAAAAAAADTKPDAGAAVAETKPDAGAAVAETKPDAAAAVAAAPEKKPDAGSVAATPPPEPKKVVLTFNVTPKDATVTVNGKTVTGKLELPPGDKPVKVAISAPGFVAVEKEITPKADQALDVTLKKEAVAKTPTKAPVRKPPKKPRIEL